MTWVYVPNHVLAPYTTRKPDNFEILYKKNEVPVPPRYCSGLRQLRLVIYWFPFKSNIACKGFKEQH